MNNVSSAMQPCDVSLMISPLDVTPVTLLLQGSNVGRGDKWYLPLNFISLYNTLQVQLYGNVQMLLLLLLSASLYFSKRGAY